MKKNGYCMELVMGAICGSAMLRPRTMSECGCVCGEKEREGDLHQRRKAGRHVVNPARFVFFRDVRRSALAAVSKLHFD